MTLRRIVAWLDRTLRPGDFDDVSANGVQIAAPGGGVEGDVRLVAFGVDASPSFLEAAAARGAGLCVVHHGLSWGGGIRRLDGWIYRAVKIAMDAGMALYASHLPLDAHPRLGNNAGLARALRLRGTRPAFSWRGNVIGLVGTASATGVFRAGTARVALEKGMKVGVCSGGAGEFAEEAGRLGCGIFVTGEAVWADRVAARASGMRLVCGGHYETETLGVEALAREMEKRLRVRTAFIREEFPPDA